MTLVLALVATITTAFGPGAEVASGFSTTVALAEVVSRTSDGIAHDAIVDAVRRRMGAGVEVVVEGLVISEPLSAPQVRAVPAPDARLGAVMHFKLQSHDGATAMGVASARVTAIVPHLHAAQPLSRGAEVGDADVTAVAHEVASGPLRAWPGAASVVGGKVLRALATGACVSRNAIQAVLAVRTGQEVTAVTRLDGVEATAVMVAAGSGDAGTVIRVVNRQSRRALKARVVSAGLVEIVK